MPISIAKEDRPDNRFGTAIPGAAVVSPENFDHPLNSLAVSPDEWEVLFGESLSVLQRLLSSRDCLSVLARCAALSAFNERREIESYSSVKGIDSLFPLLRQPQVEFLYALCLMQPCPSKKIPTSPRNTTKIINETVKCVHSFLQKQPPQYPNDADKEHVLRGVRAQTVYYRNRFSQNDCELVVSTILRAVDEHSTLELGFRLSEVFSFLCAIAEKIDKKLQVLLTHVIAAKDASSESAAIDEIDYFCSLSSLAKRTWSLWKNHCSGLNRLRFVAFQLSEFCYKWAYTIDLRELRDAFPRLDFSFFDKISFGPGELRSEDPERFLLANPIWRKPYLALNENVIFAPLPMICYSFPFLIMEEVIGQNKSLRASYFDARARSLENLIQTLVQDGMPSAKVHSNVSWRDEYSGTVYENDIVAETGNSIFLFEAKSGRLNEVSRRGGELSLRRDFSDLFVLPGEQASRLARYLNTRGQRAKLWSKDTGSRIELDLETPKVVHKFSICIEHFAELTNGKQNLKALGAIEADADWAPVLSIGELMLIWRHIDTEVSFYHYLTRRAALEDYVNMEGDEQDILSLYLMTGFCIDPKPFKENQLRFFGFDARVRIDKNPRNDRTEFHTLGIRLPKYWHTVLKEIYQTGPKKHRFDMIEVILNQHPNALEEVSGKARRWRQSVTKRKENLFVVCNRINDRTFALAYHVTNGLLRDEDWLQRARNIAGNAAAEYGATDCLVMHRVRKSKERTFQAASFYRLGYVGKDRVGT